MKKLLALILLCTVGLPIAVDAQSSELTSECVSEAMTSDPDIAVFRLTNANLVATESTPDAVYHLLFMHTDEDPDSQIEVVVKQGKGCSVSAIDPGGNGIDYASLLPTSVANSFSKASKLFWTKQIESR